MLESYIESTLPLISPVLSSTRKVPNVMYFVPISWLILILLSLPRNLTHSIKVGWSTWASPVVEKNQCTVEDVTHLFLRVSYSIQAIIYIKYVEYTYVFWSYLVEMKFLCICKQCNTVWLYPYDLITNTFRVPLIPTFTDTPDSDTGICVLGQYQYWYHVYHVIDIHLNSGSGVVKCIQLSTLQYLGNCQLFLTMS